MSAVSPDYAYGLLAGVDKYRLGLSAETRAEMAAAQRWRPACACGWRCGRVLPAAEAREAFAAHPCKERT